MYWKLFQFSNTVIIDQTMTVFRFSCHKKAKILPHFGALGERRPRVKVSSVMKRIERSEHGIRLARKDQRLSLIHICRLDGKTAGCWCHGRRPCAAWFWCYPSVAWLGRSECCRFCRGTATNPAKISWKLWRMPCLAFYPMFPDFFSHNSSGWGFALKWGVNQHLLLLSTIIFNQVILWNVKRKWRKML